MLNLNAGALRRAMENTRAGHLVDATALIQKTLAQHGLVPSATGTAQPMANSVNPTKTPAGRKGFTCQSGSRDYVVHRPDGKVRGVLLMLHGCTQTPEDFATGTNIVEQADAMGIVVILPVQSQKDNAQSCWSWFSGADQKRGRGEPAILAALTAQIAAEHGIDNKHTYVAGLSAGGAMAVILGQTYPDVFQGVGVHSGLPYGCARGVTEAFGAMNGTSPRARSKPAACQVPTIVFHGTADQTVKPANGEHIIADTLDALGGQQTQLVNRATAGGRSFCQTTTLAADGTTLAEHWQIDGLGHAWSGGNSRGSHTDVNGPDATAEMLRFFTSLTHSEV
jgi:poly(hydroxyalkanoate) depolymerase family esterase